jgi:molybdopterin adenylyltransferase
MKITTGILTVSDRSAANLRPDLTGPALINLVSSLGWENTTYQVVPDDISAIRHVLKQWASLSLNVVFTAGGTGCSPKDVTPEATLGMITRSVPGIAEHIRLTGFTSNPHALLSRGVAGIYLRTLIINLPGSPSAAVDSLKAICGVIPHAIQLINDTPDSELGHVSGD